MLPDFECSDDPIVCCTHLFDVGEQIKDIALEAVNNPDCYDEVCAAPNVEGIVTIGRASGYPPDLVTVSLVSFGPSVRSNDNRNNTRAAITWRAMWNIQLVESGWQTFEDLDDDIVMVDPAVFTAMTKASMSHAEQMYRRVVNAALRNQLGGCGKVGCWKHIGDLFPVDPSGLTVGWSFQLGIGIDLDRSCSES
jgi:hypothetical protein